MARAKHLLGLADPDQLLQIRQLLGSDAPKVARYPQYAHDPVGYARDVLGVHWWQKQQEVAEAILKPPYRVLVPSGHSCGKTNLAGGLVNWFYDTNDPCTIITTAPTARDVRDLLWKEVRMQRKDGSDLQPKMPEMSDADDHLAKGFTARLSESFRGRHDKPMLFLFDEATGVGSQFWENTKTMWKPEPGFAWVCFYNPTDTASRAYIEDHSEGWTVVRMSSLEHPNIKAQLEGRPPPIPKAVTLSQIETAIRDECTQIDPVERRATDFEWPPESGIWYRPSPVFEARWMGRWPSQSTNSIWSDADWELVSHLVIAEPTDVPEIGADIAREGDDRTEIHARRGGVSLHHESHSKVLTTETTGYIITVARMMADHHNRTIDPAAAKISEKDIPIKVDDGGVGGGVTDQLREQGYYAVPINSQSEAREPRKYPNIRSELWFNTEVMASCGEITFAKIPAEMRDKLRLQFMAPKWKMDSRGRRVVEPKHETKKECGRSPDSADAINLAYYGVPAFEAPEQPDPSKRPGHNPQDRRRVQGSNWKRKGMYGTRE